MTHLKAVNIVLLLIISSSFLHCKKFLKNNDSTRKNNVSELSKKFLTGNWINRKEAVVKIIKNIDLKNNEFIADALVVALKDVHASVRIEALKGLALIKSSKTTQDIRDAALHDTSDNVKWYAYMTLAQFKDPSLLDVFINGFSNNDWLIREASVKGMLMLDNASLKGKAIPYIIKAINDPNESVRITTLMNVKIKNEILYQEISKTFLKCKELQYSLIKASLIALMGYKLDKKTRSKIINLLVHANSELRITALRVLKKEKKVNLKKEIKR